MTTDIQTAIRAQIIQAHKAGDTVAKEVLRVALGEIQLADKGNSTLEDKVAAVKKVLKGINNTLENCEERPELVAGLKHEKETLESVLKDFVPQTMSKEDVVQFLKEQNYQPESSLPNQCMGGAMKLLKSCGKSVNGKDVSAAITELIVAKFGQVEVNVTKGGPKA